MQPKGTATKKIQKPGVKRSVNNFLTYWIDHHLLYLNIEYQSAKGKQFRNVVLIKWINSIPF